MIGSALNYIFGFNRAEPVDWGKKLEADRQAQEHFVRMKTNEQLRWLISQKQAAGSSLHERDLAHLFSPLQPDKDEGLELPPQEDR